MEMLGMPRWLGFGKKLNLDLPLWEDQCFSTFLHQVFIEHDIFLVQADQYFELQMGLFVTQDNFVWLADF